MLDELLGRAELKARIEELTDEKRHLERRLEAESERRAAAVTDRQDAEQRVNRLEDRIAELEDRVDRSDDETRLDYRGTESLRGDRLAAVLGRLRSVEAAPEGALTATVADEPPASVRDALGDRAALVGRAAPCLVVADDAGLVGAALSAPRPPAPFAEWDDGFRLEAPWFRPTGRFVLALARSDVFALGVYEDGEREAFEAVESDVQGDHSKGGFSQRRFERRRDEQIASHLDGCRAVLDDYDEGETILVGERTVLDDLGDRADRTAAVDATGDPEEALASAFRSFFTTRLYLL